ncbi:MAG: hypothetical protein ABW185_04650 [Sedimenticola sp.]
MAGSALGPGPTALATLSPGTDHTVLHRPYETSNEMNMVIIANTSPSYMYL